MGKTTRVAICGMKGVGKTAILEQLIYGSVNMNTELHPTIEDIYVANIETDRGTREKVRFYDMEGIGNISGGGVDRQHLHLAKNYIGFADGFILVYDTEKPESLDAIVTLKKDIDRSKDKKEITIIIIGNHVKPPEPGSLENTVSKASHWASREKLRHFEVNAMERCSLYEPFVYLTSKLNPPPTKSSFPQLSMVRKSIGRPDAN